jgi:hypothetical protein
MSNLLDWFTPTRWIVLGVLALGLISAVVGYGEWRASSARTAERQRWELAIGRQKVEAAQLLATETRKVLDLERRLTAALAAQEKTDADNARTVEALRADLRRKSRAGGGPGLRDPFAAGCGGGGGGSQAAAPADAGAGAADRAEAGRALSAELEGFLIEQAAAADAINIAYASCRADSQAVRAQAP